MLYSVVDLRHCVFNNDTEVLVEVFLRKPLMGNFLTQFLPTAMFLMIRQAIIYQYSIKQLCFIAKP